MIAAGHPYYGKMAAALAATLKAADVNTNIHLAHTGEALKYLSEEEKALFNSNAGIPAKYYTYKNEPKYIMAKMYIEELSPFEETIFLDSDIAWLKKPVADLFAQLSSYAITFANRGANSKQSVWADIDTVKKAYNVEAEKYYSLHSEFIYFKKNEEVKNFFKCAQKTYSSLKVSTTVFAGAIADELPFTIACMLTKMYPHADNFTPIFWQQGEKKRLHVSQLSNAGFYGLSMGGHYNPKESVMNYKILVNAAYHKLGLKNPFKWKDKRSFLPERSKI